MSNLLDSEPEKDNRDAVRVYNELFRALAAEGRDLEFLSLWNEAKNRTLSSPIKLIVHSQSWAELAVIYILTPVLSQLTTE